MTVQNPKILVVDDVLANRVAMRRLLARVDAEVIEAASGNQALAACLENEFALILLDVNMPGMDGFEVATILGEESSTRETPIIFVTAALRDDLNQLRGYGSGAVDFIAKPINDVILVSKVKVFLELYSSKAQLRSALHDLHLRNDELNVEIAERQRAEQQARHQATHDVLTGLPNRVLFMDRLETAIDRARRRDRPFALTYIDIDDFKPVNDHHGHLAGDALLRGIAQRLRDDVRREDTVARLGGDEFAVIMEEAIDTEGIAMRLGESLCRALYAPYRIDVGGVSLTVEIGASLGIALFPAHGVDADGLILAADRAMYAAKASGKNRCLLAAYTSFAQRA